MICKIPATVPNQILGDLHYSPSCTTGSWGELAEKDGIEFSRKKSRGSDCDVLQQRVSDLPFHGE